MRFLEIRIRDHGFVIETNSLSARGYSVIIEPFLRPCLNSLYRSRETAIGERIPRLPFAAALLLANNTGQASLPCFPPTGASDLPMFNARFADTRACNVTRCLKRFSLNASHNRSTRYRCFNKKLGVKDAATSVAGTRVNIDVK